MALLFFNSLIMNVISKVDELRRARLLEKIEEHKIKISVCQRALDSCPQDGTAHYLAIANIYHRIANHSMNIAEDYAELELLIN